MAFACLAHNRPSHSHFLSPFLFYQKEVSYGPYILQGLGFHTKHRLCFWVHNLKSSPMVHNFACSSMYKNIPIQRPTSPSTLLYLLGQTLKVNISSWIYFLWVGMKWLKMTLNTYMPLYKMSGRLKCAQTQGVRTPSV